MTVPARSWVPLAVTAVLLAAGAWLLSPSSGADGRPSCGARAAAATAAVVDSGIAPVLGDRVVRRIDLVGGHGPLDPHGTEMAGIIAGRAPSARLVDVRVLDAEGRGTAARLAAGIDAALAAGVDVVNLSTTVPDDDAVLGAIRRADRAGVRVVVAAGNEGRDIGRSARWRALADLPCVEVVGAVTATGSHLARTNGGSAIEVQADGDRVPTVGLTGEATAASGTSAAAAVRSAELAG